MENNQNKQNDKRNSLLGLLLVAGVVFYIWKTRKPKAYAIESGESTESGGGGGGGGVIMGGGMPLIVTPPAPPVPPANTTPPPSPAVPKPVFKDKGNGGTTVTCGSGYIYNPATRKCEPIKDVPISEKTAKDAMKDALKSGGLSPAPVGGGLSAYDPCKSNGYGGTYDPATNSCKLSPYCGGGTLKLDSNGKAAGCEIKLPTTGSGGVVAVGFSGKMPLTLDNILH
jgi:hypothetical protein